ncbi:MAG: methyltransferase domain-containing protein [Cyanobacteria bacterium]|nr:methyltransferase domain-containing protein [Cyanobacteriota bacterium]
MREDEQATFWAQRSHAELAELAAELHRQRNVALKASLEKQIFIARKSYADIFIHGKGVEIGAGSRPWPIPAEANCHYGDVLNEEDLKKYHSSTDVVAGARLNAQTMEGIPPDSLDFVISAHVLEHLHDPLGALKRQLECLKRGGILLFAVPDKRHTWDKDRPITTLAHLEADFLDGGVSTLLDAYVEHLTYVHPVLAGVTLSPEQISDQAQAAMEQLQDIHFHTWTTETLGVMLQRLGRAQLIKLYGPTLNVNENIAVIRKI